MNFSTESGNILKCHQPQKTHSTDSTIPYDKGVTSTIHVQKEGKESSSLDEKCKVLEEEMRPKISLCHFLKIQSVLCSSFYIQTIYSKMLTVVYSLYGHKFEQALGVGDGQGGLACCGPWGLKESDMTE